jgi:hypothetical protein
MGGNVASTAPLDDGAQTALGEPAGGTEGRVAGDSQGGRLADGTAADSQPGAPG